MGLRHGPAAAGCHIQARISERAGVVPLGGAGTSSLDCSWHADEQQFKGTTERVETLQMMATGLQEQVVRLAAQSEAGRARLFACMLSQ